MNAKTTDGWTALIGAATFGLEKVVNLLLENSACVNAKTNSGWTALIGATFNGNAEIIKLLLEKSTNINAVFEGKTALDWARDQGQDKIAQLLLQYSRRLL